MFYFFVTYADIGFFCIIARGIVPPAVTDPVPAVNVEEASIRPVPEVAHIPPYPIKFQVCKGMVPLATPQKQYLIARGRVPPAVTDPAPAANGEEASSRPGPEEAQA